VIRATVDVDFLLAIPQVALPAILDDLRAEGFSLRPRRVIREWVRGHMTQFERRGTRIDWLSPVLPAFQEVLNRAVTHDIGVVKVRVASAEGLMLLKLIAFRGQDKLDVQGLLAAHPRLDIQFVRDHLERIFEFDAPRFSWLAESIRQFCR
jgi:predicted nucleotidyltransferase